MVSGRVMVSRCAGGKGVQLCVYVYVYAYAYAYVYVYAYVHVWVNFNIPTDLLR